MSAPADIFELVVCARRVVGMASDPALRWDDEGSDVARDKLRIAVGMLRAALKPFEPADETDEVQR